MSGVRMREERAALALLLFVLMAHIAFLLPQVGSSETVTEKYVATICPGPSNGGRGTALLPVRTIGVRELARSNEEFGRSPLGTRSLSAGALVIKGDPRNTVELQSKSGKWTAATNCLAGESTSWFVGGTANVSSQGRLIMINSGLSDAIVEVTPFSESGPGAPTNVTIKALTERSVKIDTLNPGAQRLALRVEIVSGRVTSYLLDERVRGLNNIGADFIAPATRPSNELIIPGLPARFGSNSQVRHTLRIMTTDDVTATASVELISPNGVYVPVGLGEIDLSSREVVDLPLNEIEIGNKPFALKISGSAPLVAAVFTEVRTRGISDFMWSSAAPTFEEVTLNLYGLEPVMTFVGERIEINLNWRTRTGKKASASISGAEIANWKIPPDTRLLTITNRSDVVGGMSWLTGDGVTFLPLQMASSLEVAPRPIADIAVIQPRS